MKWILILLLVAAPTKTKQKPAHAAADADDSTSKKGEVLLEGLPLAKPCDPDACQLPDCRCSSTDIPGGLNAKDVPQFVLVTFDDGINILNIETYRKLIYNRRNKNGCPVGATYYVSHEYTHYTLVNELYNQGLEIALHSISHQLPPTYWQLATYENMKKEFVDQRYQMSHFARIPYDSIKGVRIPFLHMTGNATFKVMADHGILYDCTMPTIHQINPGLWPYSLDYASTQDCVIPPCPTASFPGVWVVPMISWLDLNEQHCSMADDCYNKPELTDEEGWFSLMKNNFERHYFGNRAPFSFFIHEWFIDETRPAIRSAFRRFLDMINNMDDVFMVNTAEMLEWVRNPVPLEEFKRKPCRTFTPAPCPASDCGTYTSDHDKTREYRIKVCTECPAAYPWLGNPLGRGPVCKIMQFTDLLGNNKCYNHKCNWC